MTIYLDVVFLENVFMNFLIMYTAGKIRKNKLKITNLLIASIIGAIYYVVILVTNSNIFTYCFLKILILFIMVRIAYNYVDIFTYMEDLLFFLVTSFIYGGIIYGTCYFISNNIFINVHSFKHIVLGIIMGYILLKNCIKNIRKISGYKNLEYTVHIYIGRKVQILKAFLDTGNSMKDPITNVPVLIVNYYKVKNMLPSNILNMLDSKIELDKETIKRIKVIPYTSIGNQNGIMIGYKADKCEIYINKEECITIDNLCLGLNTTMLKDENIDSLLSIDILEMNGRRKYDKITN